MRFLERRRTSQENILKKKEEDLEKKGEESLSDEEVWLIRKEVEVKVVNLIVNIMTTYVNNLD